LAERERAGGEHAQEYGCKQDFLHHRGSPFLRQLGYLTGGGTSITHFPPEAGKQKHGLAQVTAVLRGLPHAASDEEAVLNWRTESALAEAPPRTSMPTELSSPLAFSLLFPGRRWAFRLAGACGAPARAKTTAAWTFTDIAAGAETSTRHNCVCACSQLVQR
jgi:hypothetical protein